MIPVPLSPKVKMFSDLVKQFRALGHSADEAIKMAEVMVRIETAKASIGGQLGEVFAQIGKLGELGTQVAKLAKIAENFPTGLAKAPTP